MKQQTNKQKKNNENGEMKRNSIVNNVRLVI